MHDCRFSHFVKKALAYWYSFSYLHFIRSFTCFQSWLLYNAAWLHGYADALAHAAESLEPQRELMEAIIGYMGERYDSAELYSILHDTLEMSDQEIRSLGFDLPQCKEPLQAHPGTKSAKRKEIYHER